MKLSEKIVVLRKQNGLSQDDLAIKLDISRQAIFKWENDQSKPEIDKLKTLSGLFNVSIDNLLDDNADILLNPSKNKKSYSAVTVLNTPEYEMAEKVNTNYNDAEKKKIKIRNYVINGGLIGMLAIIPMFALYFIITFSSDVYGPAQEFAFQFFLIGGFIVFGISLLAHFVGKKFVFPDAYDTRSYFCKIVNEGEAYLKSKGCEYTMLQPDLPVWFYYDLVNDDKFGFYFNGKEQFVCPIQNYITLKYETIMQSIKVSISYFDMDGNIKDYIFFLATIRAYVTNILTNKEDLEYAFSNLEKNTLTLLSEIKKRLDSKKEIYKTA